MYEYVEFVRVVFIWLERIKMGAVEATWNLHACIKTNKNRTWEKKGIFPAIQRCLMEGYLIEEPFFRFHYKVSSFLNHAGISLSLSTRVAKENQFSWVAFKRSSVLEMADWQDACLAIHNKYYVLTEKTKTDEELSWRRERARDGKPANFAHSKWIAKSWQFSSTRRHLGLVDKLDFLNSVWTNLGAIPLKS